MRRYHAFEFLLLSVFNQDHKVSLEEFLSGLQADMPTEKEIDEVIAKVKAGVQKR